MAKHTKYVFITAFVAFIILSYLIIRPYFTPIIAGMIVSFIFYPLYKKLNEKLPSKNLWAFLITVLALIMLFLPVVFLLTQIGYQAKVSYVMLKKRLVSGDLLGEEICKANQNIFCDLNQQYKELSEDPAFVYQRNNIMQTFEDYLWKATPDIITLIPNLLLQLFIMGLAVFYSLREGQQIFVRIRDLIPLKASHKKKILNRIKEVSNAVVYGHVITGLVQGVIGMIGLYIFKIPSALVLGLAMIFASLIPFVGAPFVWVPVSLLRIFEGISANDQRLFASGLGLFLYGFFIVSTIDNIIKPKLVGEKARINPLIILVGLFGGLALFGLIGIIVGPLVLALTITLMEIYEEERDEITG